MSTPNQDASGALTIEQAIDVLRTPAEAAAAPETEPAEEEEAPEGDAPEGAEEPESEADPGAEDVDGADEPEEGDPPAEDEDADEPEPDAPAVEAPHFWDAQAKDAFAKLPPALQQVVVEQERGREAVKARAMEEAATARKNFEGRASQLTQLGEEIAAFLPDAVKVFTGKWETVDWSTLAREDPAKYVADRAEFEAEQAQLQKLQAANAATQKVEFDRFVTAERETLTKLATEQAPELLDPKIAPQRLGEVASYIVGQGIPADRLSFISAAETLIAYKAMKYDQAQAAARAAASKTPKPVTATKVTRAPAPAQRAVRPTPPPPARTPRQSSLDAAERNLDRAGSIDAGIAVLRARRNTKGR